MTRQTRLAAISTLGAAAFLVSLLTAAPVSRTPKSDGTERQTASPWTGAADQFDTPGRDKTLRLPTVFKDLGLQNGSRVADIGAGGGWLTVRLALQVAPDGAVYAEEILPKYTKYIENRAQRMGLKNVQTILGTPTDPKLPGNTLDAAVILNAYHEFEQPLTMLNHIKAALKTGGKLGILERDDEPLRQEAREAYAKTGKILRRVQELDDKNPLTDDHRLAREVVEREATQVGFKKISERELGGDNYLVVLAR